MVAIVGREVWDSLPQSVPIRDTQLRARCAKGLALRVLGMVTVSAEIVEGKTITIPALVCPEFQFGLLIGVPGLLQARIDLLFSREPPAAYFSFHDVVLPALLDNTAQSQCIAYLGNRSGK